MELQRNCNLYLQRNQCHYQKKWCCLPWSFTSHGDPPIITKFQLDDQRKHHEKTEKPEQQSVESLDDQDAICCDLCNSSHHFECSSLNKAKFLSFVENRNCINFLAVWRNHILMSKDQNIKENFISRQTYQDILLSTQVMISFLTL